MTYSVEVLRYIASGISSFNIMVSLSVLAVFTLAISVAASWVFSRRK